MQRIVNWDVKLVEYALSLQGQPFVWGQTDCASIVRGAMRAMYGEDLWSEGYDYTSLLEAKRLLEVSGGVAMQLSLLGAEEVPRGFLQQGDVVVGEPLDEDFADNVFVMVSDQLLSATLEEGVVMRPLALMPVNPQILRMPHGW